MTLPSDLAAIRARLANTYHEQCECCTDLPYLLARLEEMRDALTECLAELNKTRQFVEFGLEAEVVVGKATHALRPLDASG